MIERAKAKAMATAMVVSERWTRAHAGALRFLSPSSLATAVEEERSKGRALINLHLGFLFCCIFYAICALLIDGTLMTDNGLVFFLGFVFYLSNLLVYRAWGNLYVTAMLLLLFIEHTIMFKSYLDGPHSETFFWVILLPQLVFFLLGQRSGAFFLAMAMFHTALLYLIQVVSTSPACGLLGWTTVDQFVTTAAAPLMTCHGAVDDLLGDATRAMGHVSDVGSSSSGWLSAVMVSKGYESPHGIFINRLSLILFVSSFAFFHENRRSLALRQIEDTLREKEAVNASLLQATEAKTNFLANMSHELRTPMHGIIAMASDLKEMPLPSKAREAIGIISDCADHLLSLVNDVLDFARIEQSQLELEQIPFCMTSEVKKALAMHSVIAKQKGVYLLVKKVRVSFPYHTGDPLRFRQIIINLLSNAIKFTPAGGQVSVSVVNKKSNPELIRVSVQDTGIGIPKSSQPHLFESFSQLDASVRRKYGGSGLGLSICKKLCEAMGGEIECRSEVGKGSDFAFFVCLPPTTKQNYREAREGDESDHNAAVTRQHRHNHHPLATPPDVSADEQKRIDDDDDDALMESDSLSDDSHLYSDSSETSSDDDDDDSSSADDDDNDDSEVDDEAPEENNAVARRHSSSSMLTKSLGITPIRRTRHSSGGPDLGRMIASASRRHKADQMNEDDGHGNDKRDGSRRRMKRNHSGRRASSPASTTAVLTAAAEAVDSRRRMSASSGSQHQRPSKLVNARRASEQHGLTIRHAVEQQQRLLNSGRGYVADDDNNNDDWLLSGGAASSSLLSSASSSFSPSASSSALSSPSSSFCSSSELLLPVPLSAGLALSPSSSNGSPQANDTDCAPPSSSSVLAGLRRGSVPFGASPSHRLLSSPALTGGGGGLNPHHASMPIIPSLASASDSPLPSPLLSLPPLPLNATAGAGPPPSPSSTFLTSLATLSTSSSSSSASSALMTMSSAQHLLPGVASRHLSLNSCASPRGIPRVRTATPPRPATPHHASSGALLLPRSAGGTPAVPPLSLSKLHSSKSAERGQSSSSPVAAANANATAPRSFYVPSFPPEAMLASPRDSPSSFSSSSSSSSDAGMPPRSAEEVYQDVMRGKRILVVEDNLINQKVALKMLSSFDCRVTVAENGLVAIKLFEESFRSRGGRHATDGEPLFHAILMDIQMPVIDGFETAIRIRELEAQFNEAEAARTPAPSGHQPQVAAVPIIALTASATKEYQQKCLTKGMNCFLSKPLKKETLVRTLTEVIKQAGYYDEAAELARRRADQERARQAAREEAELRARTQRQREIEELREKRKAREQATIMMMMGMAATNAALAINKLHHHHQVAAAAARDDQNGDDDGDNGELGRRRMAELLRAKGRSRHVKHNSIG